MTRRSVRGTRITAIAVAVVVAAGTSVTLPAAASATSAPTTTATTTARARALPGPLHTDGRFIVDRRDKRVKLASVNWSGAETGSFVVGGLDVRTLGDLARTIREGGFNSVRLPWSNELVEENPVVRSRYLTANPRLQGKRALTILDAVIAALGKQGVMVVLDNHRSTADWCCDEDHGDGLWYSPEYSEADWIADWQTMARRYKHAKNVVAAELRNEIRPEPQLAPGPTTATWGDGNPLTDWRAAAQRGGNAVLGVNPKLLVMVGGTEYQGNLTFVRKYPVHLDVAHRLVYAAHDYRFFHADAEVSSYAAFAKKLNTSWGYVVNGDHAWTAPVYVSETGTCTNPNPTEQCAALDPTYLKDIARYLKAKDLDFAYWPFNGSQGVGYNRTYGAPETYGLLAPDWSGYGDLHVLAVLQSLQKPLYGPAVAR